MEALNKRHCVPCKGGVPPVNEAQRNELLLELGHDWSVVDGHHLSKTYIFDDFISGLNYVNIVGAIAEREGHHPDIFLTWGKVTTNIWTHKINGLTESDFILAAKIQGAFDDNAS